MNIFDFPPEIIGIITDHLDEDSIFNLTVSCKRLQIVVGFYWIRTVADNIYDIVYDILNNKLHIINSSELLKYDVIDNVFKLNNIIYQNQNINFYDLVKDYIFENIDYHNKIFKGISHQLIKSYKLVYLQLIYNQVYKRRFKFNLIFKN